MAEEDDVESKTEEPTDRRMEELSRMGQLHISVEFSQAVAFFALVVFLYFWIPHIINSLLMYLSASLRIAGNVSALTDSYIPRNIPSLASLASLIPILLTPVFISVGLGLVQTKGNVKEKILNFNLSTLNPINGFQRLFSLQHLFQIAKSIGKLLALTIIIYFICRQEVEKIMFSANSSFADLQRAISFSGSKILFTGAIVILIFGIMDYGIGYLLWLRKNRMTKQEVKDDRKASEGDETVKRQIRSKVSRRILQQIRKNISTSTALVVNPTHFAVALRYQRGVDDAPVVTAKGVDHLALRMREIAREFGVPIIERPSLARALYASAKVGKPIPLEFFRAVAEVIAYVYRIKGLVVKK